MIISSHLHFRRYPPIYPNIIPRYYIPDNTIQYYSHYIDFEGPSCIYSNWTYTMLTIQTNPMQTQCCFCCPSYFICPTALRFWSADPREVRRWNGETWNFAVEKSTLLDGLDVNVLSHQTCSTGKAFPAPWIQKYAIFESLLMIRLFRWKHLVSLLLTFVRCPPQKKAPGHLVSVFFCATMSPGYTESKDRQII